MFAGEAVRDTINRTQQAMRRLRHQLDFGVSADAYNRARVNHTQHVLNIRRRVQRDFRLATAHLHTCVTWLKRAFPLAVLLLVAASYSHVKRFMSDDVYDNNYVDTHFRSIDAARAQHGGKRLLPLKNYERMFLVDVTQSDLSAAEDDLYSVGLALLSVHVALSVVCYLFDFILFWILNSVARYGNPEPDVTGQASLQDVIEGDGAIASMLHVFLSDSHRGAAYSFVNGENTCLPLAHAPCARHLAAVSVMYVVITLTILLKAYLLRLRHRITHYFYRKRGRARTVHLYNVILSQRSRMRRILQQRARVNEHLQRQRKQISLCHRVASKCAPCRVFLYDSPRCVVCSATSLEALAICETELCTGAFCAQCFADLNYTCPLCMHGAEYEATDDVSNASPILEDDLKPYCASSKVYI